MGDECTCEKCQVCSASEPGAFVWPIMRGEAQEGHGHTGHSFYLIVTERGISLHQQSFEM